MEQTPLAKQRIHLMDELRGFAVFCMVFYHGFYTLAYLYHLELGKILLYFFMPAEPWFAGLFILIAGVSSNLSHSNLIRGLKLAGVALVVTLATWLVVPEERILFGILHFLHMYDCIWADSAPSSPETALHLDSHCHLCPSLFVYSTDRSGNPWYRPTEHPPSRSIVCHRLACTFRSAQSQLFFLGLFSPASMDFRLFCRHKFGAPSR